MDKMDKMCKTANWIDIIVKVLYWFFAVLSLIAVIAGIAGGVALKKIPEGQNGSFHLTLNNASAADIDLSELSPAWIGKALVFFFITIVLAVIMLTVYYRYIRRILKPMRQGQPFAENEAADIKMLGWWTIICGIIGNVLKAVSIPVLMRGLPEKILEDIGPVNVGVDIGFIIIALVFFLCSYIFHYGQQLQRLTDDIV